jgi:NodT family efflux transporter outer membrane factor (OMF) lipoprotein
MPTALKELCISARAAVSGTFAAVLLLLSGCTPVGPNYQRASVPTPPAFKEPPPAGWKDATPHDEISKGNWWEVFGDPQLNDLETQALMANQTLQAAVQNVLQSRANLAVSRSQQYPQIGAQPSLSGGRVAGTRPVPPGSSEQAYTDYQLVLPADVSYEVDLWGGIRRSVESARAQVQASVANYENVLLTFKSDVAEDYVMTRFIDEERVVLKNNIDLQQKALDLTQVRHEGGVASGLDVSEAETLLDTTQADYIGLGVQRAQFEHALAVLLGKAPAEFSLPNSPLDLKPPAIPPGLPSDLLERRPDVAAAERTMAADNAQIGVARAAFFPALNLTGSGGLLTGDLGKLFTVPAIVWSAAANMTAPLYTGGALQGNLVRAQATYDQSVANYREQVLTAFQQVEDDLAGLRVLEDQAAAYDKAVQSAQQTVDISTSRYREGLANFLEVITAQVTLLNNQRIADQIAEQRLLTTIELIQALGGGWQESTIYSTARALTSTPPQPAQPTPSGAAPPRP